MSSVWTIVLAFIALVFFSISATVHGDCASCCQGKWSQCFTICEDMDQCSECSSECTEEKETCVGNCPGSRSLKSAASISSSSFRRALPWVPEDFFSYRYFFLLGALRLVNAASPRTISVHKKKISSGTQGSRAFANANNLKMHKFQRRLRKFVKRLNRRQIA